MIHDPAEHKDQNKNGSASEEPPGDVPDPRRDSRPTLPSFACHDARDLVRSQAALVSRKRPAIEHSCYAERVGGEVTLGGCGYQWFLRV